MISYVRQVAICEPVREAIKRTLARGFNQPRQAAGGDRGTDNAYKLAKTYKIKTAWGTDTLFDAALATKQGKQLAKMVRWYTPAEVLRMATSGNAELLALSGPRSPYVGKLFKNIVP